MTGDVIATIDKSISIVRRLWDVSKNASEAEFKNLLADLQIELADAKLEIAALKAQLAERNEELLALRRTDPANREKPEIDQCGWYRFSGSEAAFCPACYETNGLKVPLWHRSAFGGTCPNCQATIGFQ